ncbi:MAG: SdpI family protein [Actinomycetota bacterium]
MVSIPLILRWIGPNSWYGFRTQKTLSSREIWFPVNAFAGWALLIACVVSAAILAFAPKSIVSKEWVALVVFVGPLVGALVVSSMYLRRFS